MNSIHELQQGMIVYLKLGHRSKWVSVDGHVSADLYKVFDGRHHEYYRLSQFDLDTARIPKNPDETRSYLSR